MAPKDKVETKSPVPKKSLPQPGESAAELLEDRWFDQVVRPCIVSLMLGMLAAMTWVGAAFKTPPWLWTALFFLSIPFSAWRYVKMHAEMRQRGQGIRGERIVGQLLEELRSLGCKVYHDVVEDRYNIDHVIIGPYGVFAVETKAPSKPAKGQSAVVFDGKTVKVGGSQPRDEVVIQAKASARRVREILLEMTGQAPHVTPVILYVNWFVEVYTRDPTVIVANQNYFIRSFDRLQNPNTLPTAQVDFFAAAMERYLRGK
jgi:hypothetical protein